MIRSAAVYGVDVIDGGADNDTISGGPRAMT